MEDQWFATTRFHVRNRSHGDRVIAAGQQFAHIAGDPSQRPCRCCKKYDALENLRAYAHDNTTSYWHIQCNRDAAKARYYKEK